MAVVAVEHMIVERRMKHSALRGWRRLADIPQSCAVARHDLMALCDGSLKMAAFQLMVEHSQHLVDGGFEVTEDVVGPEILASGYTPP